MRTQLWQFFPTRKQTLPMDLMRQKKSPRTFDIWGFKLRSICSQKLQVPFPVQLFIRGHYRFRNKCTFCHLVCLVGYEFKIWGVT